MNILKGSVLKVFGAVVLVSMIGALVAEPVALGDCGAYLANNADSNWAKIVGYAAQGLGSSALRAAATVALSSWELYLVCPEAAIPVLLVGGSGAVLSY